MSDQSSLIHNATWPVMLNRRAFIKGSTLFLTAAATGCSGMQGFGGDRPVKIGLITDIHYADKTRVNTRYYRDSLKKMKTAVAYFNEVRPHFIVQMGDLVDAAESVETELEYLATIEAEFAKAKPPRHYVLGNHCVDTLTKEEFIANTGATKPYYSFDRGGFHFVILDACFREDGEPYGRNNSHWRDTNIPPVELKWLKEDLANTKKSTILFIHQRLDETQHHSVNNNDEVREILEASGKVLAVFQGHSHENEYAMVNGIHYCVVRAMVEGQGETNNSYGLLTISPDGSMMVDGFVRQSNYNWPAANAPA